jgi:hypothetical protein
MSKGFSTTSRPDRSIPTLVKRLRMRQSEIEDAIFTHVGTVLASVEIVDAAYEVGLRAAIASVIEYAYVGIERGVEWSAPIPWPAVAQARRAMHYGVGPETVVLRYLAGHKMLGAFITKEAMRSGFSSQALCDLRGVQELLLERLTASIADEYRQEAERVGRSPARRHRELVQKLLCHEHVDLAEFDYEFDGISHIGVVATGTGVERVLNGVAKSLGRGLLYVSCGDGTVWAWFGGRRRTVAVEIKHLLSSNESADTLLALGGPQQGIDGWRLTHHEAQAAFSVALRKPKPLTLCSDVPLEAAVIKHEAIAKSLLDNYLAPLDDLRGGGLTARKTLLAYFGCRRNASLTAKKLSVKRQTVENRLDSIEECLGRPVHTCYPELEVALRVEELRQSAAPDIALPDAT